MLVLLLASAQAQAQNIGECVKRKREDAKKSTTKTRRDSKANKFSLVFVSLLLLCPFTLFFITYFSVVFVVVSEFLHTRCLCRCLLISGSLLCAFSHVHKASGTATTTAATTARTATTTTANSPASSQVPATGQYQLAVVVVVIAVVAVVVAS